jgi:drug/metabolite transporter (DMT)-like permease
MSRISKSKSSLGAGLIILSSLFYATYGIWTTLMGNFFNGYTASALRSALVLIILLPIAFFYKKIDSLDLKKNWKKLLAMTFISTLIWGLLYYSVLEAGVGISLTVTYAAIVIGMMVFGWLLAGEKFTGKKVLSVTIGIIGLSLIFIETSSGSILLAALIAALVSGGASAANTVLAKQLPYNATQTTCVLWATSIIANFPMVFILNEPIPQFGFAIEWVYLIIFAIASILASLTLMNGLRYIEAGLAGIIGLMEIVFGIFFGIVLFNESIGSVTLLGVVIILVASIIPYFHMQYKNKTLK